MSLTYQVTRVSEAFATEAVKACVPTPATSVTEAGDTVTDTGSAIATGVGHAGPPATDGAEVVAALGPITTSAESVLPASSVTVRRTVKDPDAGATAVTVSVSAPTRPGGGPLLSMTAHEYRATERLQAAPLPPARSCTFWPGDTLAGTATAATGRSAARTEAAALAMPAPQVCVVHTHSDAWMSDELAGTRHTGTDGSVDSGNGRVAPSCRRASNCTGVSRPFTAAISPAMPETIGAAKLVPTL